jgi:aspartate/methionine/tyrosine aminotransferase
MRISSRGQVDPFIVMDVLAAARAREALGHRVIHMEIGQPGTAAPAGARAAVAAAMSEGSLGYTVALGLPALRAGIAGLYRRWYGIDLDPARVVVTSGSSGAFLLAFTALFDAGEKVALGLPGYPSYRQILTALSLQPVGIPTRLANRLQPVASEVPEGVRGLIVASPGNPSGTMLSRGALMGLMHVARERGIAVISDEIYHGLHYDARAVSALEISDDVYVVNSFSKYFSMTGWRVGWMVVPEGHVRMVERLAQNMFICAPHAAQVAALAALDCGAELEGNRAVYARNRKAMLKGLPGAGFGHTAPADGAFYVYADVSDVTDDSVAFCAEVLDQAGVAITPGVDFDAARGRHWVRFCYAGATADIVEGLERLKGFMNRR